VTPRWQLIVNGIVIGLTVMALAAVNFVGFLWINSEQQRFRDIEIRNQRNLQLAFQIQVNFKIQVQEWKNILLRGHDPVDFAKYFSAFERREAATQSLAAELLQSGGLGEQLRADISFFQQRHAILGSAYRETLQSHSPSDAEAIFLIDDAVRGIDRPPMEVLDKSVDTIQKNLAESRHDAAVRLASLTRHLIAVSALCLLIAIAIVIFYTVTRRRYELHLSRAIAASKKADEAKSRFLAHMSHEIRTPMNGIVAGIDLLHDNDLPAKVQETLDVMESSAESLTVIVDDILDISRIEAGKLQLAPETVELARFLQTLALSTRPVAESKDLEFRISLDLPEGLCVKVDPIRLRQVLSNLLANAIKFTQTGSVSLSVETLPSEGPSDHARIRFDVVDTGIGIDPEKQKSLFKAFVQLDDSYTRRHQGTGLGLVISRHIIDSMGGSIAVESTLGSGSRFTVEIEVPRIEASLEKVDSGEGALPANPLRPLKTVLLVDDVATNRIVAQRLLEKLNLSPDAACNGLEAIDKAMASSYDLILMDCQMPEMDGYEATRLIRKHNTMKKVQQPVIIAMTAHAMQEHIDECLQSGMDNHISKPLRLQTLIACLVNYFQIEHPVAQIPASRVS
jgi:signal transduction histidine kinase/ActR/RegA family two-component response regulator